MCVYQKHLFTDHNGLRLQAGGSVVDWSRRLAVSNGPIINVSATGWLFLRAQHLFGDYKLALSNGASIYVSDTGWFFLTGPTSILVIQAGSFEINIQGINNIKPKTGPASIW